ncbi:hypothetical protein [Actinocorallia longicatena]|uniref:Uncharacterized protein n=1 Tax=Actinocorallia longicatena TaxID=111803 RepID=A0ABP6QE05_9ACTN
MPRIGPPAKQAWTCAHMPDLQPPECGEPANWHGIHWGQFVSLYSCDEHVWKVRELADVVHPLGSACGLPGSVYDDELETCLLPDTDPSLDALLAAEPELAGASR